MRYNAGYVTCFAGFFIMVGHIGVLPYLFFFSERISTNDAIDIAFLVAPLTASSFVATIRFAIENREVNLFDPSKRVNGFFVLAAFAAVVPFMIAIYVLIWATTVGARFKFNSSNVASAYRNLLGGALRVVINVWVEKILRTGL